MTNAIEISAEDRDAYARDGAVCLRGLFDDAWLDRLRVAIDRDIEKPGPMGMRYGRKSDEGTFFGDMYMWTYDPDFRAFALESPAAEIAGALMGSKKVNLFYDHLLVKEPGSESLTPWHHDLPYWCVEGDQVCSIWLALDPVDKTSGAVEFVRGSHRWGKLFRAQDFRMKTIFADPSLEEIPDIDADRDAYEFLSWDTEPGDCIVFHALTVHGAPGNAASDRRRRALSTRWAGDDAVYIERPAMSEPLRDPGLKPGDPLDSDLFPVVWRGAA